MPTDFEDAPERLDGFAYRLEIWILAPAAVSLKVAACAAFLIQVPHYPPQIVAKSSNLIIGCDARYDVSLLFSPITIIASSGLDVFPGDVGKRGAYLFPRSLGIQLSKLLPF